MVQATVIALFSLFSTPSLSDAFVTSQTNWISPNHPQPGHSLQTTRQKTQKTFGLPSTLLAANVLEIDDTNYRSILQDNEFVLVDTYAKWCGPCRLMEGVVKSVANRWSTIGAVGRFDAEQGQDFKMELVLQDVRPMKLPSFVVFRNGKAVGQREGMLSADQMDEFLESCAVPKPLKGRVSLVRSDATDESYMLTSAL